MASAAKDILREHTLFTQNSYPDYARPDDGRTFEKGGYIYDNRDVVPYNAYLSAKYEFLI